MLLRKLFDNENKKLNIVIAFALGILLLVSNIKIPQKKQVITIDNYESKLESRLENILSEASGVGKVKVMITLAYSKEIVVAEDVDQTTNIQRKDNIETRDEKRDAKKIIIKSQGDDKPLVLKEIEPKISGVIIIAQGGDDIYIREALIRTAETILNVSVNKVQVLKMRE